MKDKTQAQLASLTQTRDTLVKLRTALKNKINNILSAHGINLAKEALSSDKQLNEVLAMTFGRFQSRARNGSHSLERSRKLAD